MGLLKKSLLLMLVVASLVDARLDIFNRQYHMLTSSKEKQASIPYKDCIQSCENCACTLINPPELSKCICLDSSTQDTDKPPTHKSAEQAVTEKPVAIPYKECVQSCEPCACTLVLPPEISDCVCLQNLTMQSSGDPEVSKGSKKRRLIPYPECIQSCKNCACTRMWPPQMSQCVCLDKSFITGVRSGIIALPT